MNKQLLGIIVLLIGNLLFTISTIFIKTLDIGFIYLITIQLSSMLIPSLIYIYFKDPDFKLLSIFKQEQLYVAVFSCIYYLFGNLSYKLLPLSLAVPYSMLYPIVILFISPIINKIKITKLSQYISDIILFIGICCFIVTGIQNAKTSNKYHTIFGFIFGFIGIISGALAIIYTAKAKIYTKHNTTFKDTIKSKLHNHNNHNNHNNNSNNNNSNNKSLKKIPPKNIKDIAYLFSVQLLNSSLLFFILFLVLSIILYLIPNKNIQDLIKLHIPKVIFNKNIDFSFISILKPFLIFFMFSYIGNIGFTIGNTYINPQIFGGLLYINIIYSVLLGYFVLNEPINNIKIIGCIIIIIGILYKFYINNPQQNNILN